MLKCVTLTQFSDKEVIGLWILNLLVILLIYVDRKFLVHRIISVFLPVCLDNNFCYWEWKIYFSEHFKIA